MTVKRLLGLRNKLHRVDLVQMDGSSRPVLGTAFPQGDANERRASTQQQWDRHAPSPRAPNLASIVEPLPQRSQTSLYYRVGPAVRQRLNGSAAAAPTRQPGQASEPVDVAPPAPDE